MAADFTGRGTAMNPRIVFTILFSSLILCSFAAFAQTPLGGVRGTVTDPSGAIVPSASVRITSSDEGSKSATSGSDGVFAFDHLLPGRYSISITVTGFAPAAINDIAVYGGKGAPANVVLQLPVDKQEVHVGDQGVSVDTSPDNNVSAIVIK